MCSPLCSPEPHAGFKIAFNMFDADGNQMVDKREFLVVSLWYWEKNLLYSHVIVNHKMQKLDIDSVCKVAYDGKWNRVEKIKSSHRFKLMSF